MDGIAMALKRLKACIPVIFHSRFCDNPLWLLIPEPASYYAAGRAEYKGCSICLKRAILDSPLVRLDEPASVSNKVGELACLSLERC